MTKRVYGVEKAISIIAAVAAGSPKEAKLELASGGSQVNKRPFQSKFRAKSHKLMSPGSPLNPKP